MNGKEEEEKNEITNDVQQFAKEEYWEYVYSVETQVFRVAQAMNEIADKINHE